MRQDRTGNAQTDREIQLATIGRPLNMDEPGTTG
jgi:hypothetical protein